MDPIIERVIDVSISENYSVIMSVEALIDNTIIPRVQWCFLE